MTAKPMAQIVTGMLLSALFVITGFTEPAFSATYKIEMRSAGKVLSTRKVDTEKPAASGIVQHVENGLALELADGAASCGVFLDSKIKGQTNVMVSLIQVNGTTADKMKSVVSNSGLLTQKDLPADQQDVLPGGAGVREVSVDAPKLKRSCIVSLI